MQCPALDPRAGKNISGKIEIPIKCGFITMLIS